MTRVPVTGWRQCRPVGVVSEITVVEKGNEGEEDERRLVVGLSVYGFLFGYGGGDGEKMRGERLHRFLFMSRDREKRERGG